jgi:hypothetical protein
MRLHDDELLQLLHTAIEATDAIRNALNQRDERRKHVDLAVKELRIARTGCVRRLSGGIIDAS